MAENKSTKHHSSFKDLTGKPFGNWTVIAEDVANPSKGTYWLCRCSCGKEASVRGSALTGDRSHGCKPCGKRQHGMCGTPEYVAWQRMNDRCNNPNSEDFPDYGGNGVTICERWKSFENFYADMGPKPSASHSVDRRDGSKGYSPENCRWATPKEQSRNRPSFIRQITFNGETLCLTDWAAKIGISVSGLHGRLAKGWSLEKALTNQPKQ
jgi:hypothetical protein